MDIDPENDVSHMSVFYKRVKAQMIAKRIEAHLTQASFKKLMHQKFKFQLTDSFGNMYNDGPTMLKINMDGINSFTRIGVSALKAQIEKATLANLWGKFWMRCTPHKHHHCVGWQP